MAVLSLIFSQLFRRSIENYPIYYLTGYLLWQAFTATTNAAMTTLADNRALLLQVKFPMELFILARAATALVNLGYSFLAYGVMLLVFRIPLSGAALAVVPVVACLSLFSRSKDQRDLSLHICYRSFYAGASLGIDGLCSLLIHLMICFGRAVLISTSNGYRYTLSVRCHYLEVHIIP